MSRKEQKKAFKKSELDIFEMKDDIIHHMITTNRNLLESKEERKSREDKIRSNC